MLFRKNIEPCCAYCIHGSRISCEEVACEKKGIVCAGESCRRFRYDPLRRDPPDYTILETSRFSEEDFVL